MLQEAAKRFAAQSQYSIVEPAHMELAEPTIAQAFGRCVDRGASRVVVFPYFLSPGRHWSDDIPSLVADAATNYPHIPWLVTAPFGLHPGMLEIINDRIQFCLREAHSQDDARCDVCENASRCEFRTAGQ